MPYCLDAADAAAGLRKTKITESPLRNIFATYLSLLTGFAFFPLPFFGVSVHISLTFSRTMLQWRSKARTRANIFLLFRQLISTCVLSLTDCVSTDKGPVLNSSSSFCFSSSNVRSVLGFELFEVRYNASSTYTQRKYSRHFPLQILLKQRFYNHVRLSYVVPLNCHACVHNKNSDHYLETSFYLVLTTLVSYWT